MQTVRPVVAVLLVLGLSGLAASAATLPPAAAAGPVVAEPLSTTEAAANAASGDDDQPTEAPGRTWGLGQAAASAVHKVGQALAGSAAAQREPEHFPEDECSRAGGMCLPAVECPAGLLAEPAGLCPRQRAQGVECCHGVSVADRRCASHGGECMASDQCAANLLYAAAEDCGKGQACCVLVGL